MIELDVAAVLLDMDGTLIDSTATVDVVWSDFARQAGFDVADVLAHVHGVPARATLRHFLGEDADIEPWYRRIEEWENERFDADVEIPGAVAAVHDLPAVREAALRRMGRLGFPEVATLIAAEDVEHGKPDPEPYRRCADALGFDVEDCVVLEDSDAGVRAARAAGATVIVVGSLATPATEGLVRVRDLTEVRFGATATGVSVAIG